MYPCACMAIAYYKRLFGQTTLKPEFQLFISKLEKRFLEERKKVEKLLREEGIL